MRRCRNGDGIYGRSRQPASRGAAAEQEQAIFGWLSVGQYRSGAVPLSNTDQTPPSQGRKPPTKDALAGGRGTLKFEPGGHVADDRCTRTASIPWVICRQGRCTSRAARVIEFIVAGMKWQQYEQHQFGNE